MERRDHPRLPITLPCEVEILRNGLLHEGLTQNLSRTGALIELNHPVAELTRGENVTVRIQLPARALFDQKCMTCSGVVARIEGGGTPARVFGLDIRNVQFESAEQMRTRPAAIRPEAAGESHVH